VIKKKPAGWRAFSVAMDVYWGEVFGLSAAGAAGWFGSGVSVFDGPDGALSFASDSSTRFLKSSTSLLKAPLYELCTCISQPEGMTLSKTELMRFPVRKPPML